MRRGILAVLFAAFLFVPVPAHAETFVVDSGPPKGVVGQDGIRCIGEADYQGHHFKFVSYEGADADEMASTHPGTERAQQENSCKRWLTDPMVYGSMVSTIRRGYDGWMCLKWHPEARLRGVDEPDDLGCYIIPAFPDFDPGLIKMRIERV